MLMPSPFPVVCSYCLRQRVDGVWLASLPPPTGAMVSHGICDECYKRLMETLDKEEGQEWDF